MFLEPTVLDVQATRDRGRGLFTLADIPQGTLVIEYVGKHVSASKVSRSDYDKTYVMKYQGALLDGSRGGNVSRFMNHSCEPNLDAEEWEVHGKARMILMARQGIVKRTELTLFYNREGTSVCLCGASGCLSRFGHKIAEGNARG